MSTEPLDLPRIDVTLDGDGSPIWADLLYRDGDGKPRRMPLPKIIGSLMLGLSKNNADLRAETEGLRASTAQALAELDRVTKSFDRRLADVQAEVARREAAWDRQRTRLTEERGVLAEALRAARANQP